MTGEDLALAIQGQVVVELRDQNVRQQPRNSQTLGDRSRWRRRLDDGFAVPAGFGQPRGPGDLELGGDKIENLRNVLADQSELAATFLTSLTRIEHDLLVRRIVGQIELATATFGRLLRCRGKIGRLVAIIAIDADQGCIIDLKLFQRQLQLLDLTSQLLRTLAKTLPLEPRDLDLQSLDQNVPGPHLGFELSHVRALLGDQRTQRHRIDRQVVEIERHSRILGRVGSSKKSKNIDDSII